MGDFAEIVPQTINGADGPEERWVLRAQRAQEVPFLGAAPREIFVAARCYLRNQS